MNHIINVYTNNNINSVSSFLEKYANELLPLSALFMDTYVLIRIFLQNDSSQIIVYTGSAHTAQYSRFIEDYLGIQPNLHFPLVPNNLCLEITNLSDYLPANEYRKYVVNKNL